MEISITGHNFSLDTHDHSGTYAPVHNHPYSASNHGHPSDNSKQDTLPTLTAGQAWVGPTPTAIDIATQAELNAHTHTPPTLASLLPTGGAWTENSLTIGNGNSILQAGDSANDSLVIRNGTQNRITISSTGVTLHGNLIVGSNTLNLTGSTVTGHGFSLSNHNHDTAYSGTGHTHTPPTLASLLPTGGAWIENSLTIGSGTTTLIGGSSLSMRNSSSQGFTIGSGTLTLSDVDIDLAGNDIIGLGSGVRGQFIRRTLYIDANPRTTLPSNNSVISVELTQAPNANSKLEVTFIATNSGREIIYHSEEIDVDDWLGLTAVTTSAGNPNNFISAKIGQGVTAFSDRSQTTLFIGRISNTMVALSTRDWNTYSNLRIRIREVYPNGLGGTMGGASFPDGGSWIQNNLRIGAGQALLRAGDGGVTDRLTIQVNDTDSLRLEPTLISAYDNLSMENNSVLNVGNSGGDWTANSLAIGSGNSSLISGGTLTISTEGSNRVVISSSGITLNGNLIVGSNTLNLTGSTVTGLSYNSLTDRPTIPDISGKQDTLPTLTAGQSWVGPSFTATDIATQAELDAHTHTPPALSSLLPTGASWIVDALRIGNWEYYITRRRF